MGALKELGHGPARVILLTAAIEARDVLQAIKLGAKGLVLKEAATRELIDGIYRVLEGKFVMDADITDDLATAIQRHESRTRCQEQECIDAIAEDAESRLPGREPGPEQSFELNNLDVDVQAAGRGNAQASHGAQGTQQGKADKS